MIVYRYDEDGYYTKPHTCQKDPKRPGELLYPGFYLSAEPPVAEGKRAKVDGKKWVLVDDPRGREIWEKSTGKQDYCKGMQIPETHTEIKPPNEYSKWDKTKWGDDSAKKSEFDAAKANADREALIQAEIRKMAEERLKQAGKI